MSPLDLAAPVIGSLFVAIGGAAAAAALSAHPFVNRTAAWFAVFCLLYGLRLLSRSELIQLVTGWPPTMFQHISAGITYAILVPATLFVESLLGPGRRALLRRTWQVTAACATGAIITDIVLQRPFAAIVINAPLVMISIAVWFWHFAVQPREGPWSTEVIVVTAAGVILALAATLETLLNAGPLGEIVIESVAMLGFASALGWFVLTRARQQEFSYAALSRELELARSIQQSLLPSRMPNVPGLRLASRYLPMTAVAGDLYDVLPLSDGRALVIMADVSGHGVPAALIASMVKVAVAAEVDRHDSPGEILTGINRALTGKFDNAYVTACCLVADPRQRSLTYAAAGHPPPLLRHADGRVEALDHGGIILTVMPAMVYEAKRVAFEPGDRVLVYTDGLTEAVRLGDTEFFGDAELARVVSSTPPSQDLLQAVLDAHRRWIGDAPVSDDISIVVIESAQ